ncbi:MAG: hypothetical protein ABI432_12305 [Flavobacteriales bacterium]
MKHVKKKFIRSRGLSEAEGTILDSVSATEETLGTIVQRGGDEYVAILLTTGQQLVQAFMYQHEGNVYPVPEANPIVLYFEIARHNVRDLNPVRRDLLASVVGQEANVIVANNKFYGFYARAAGAVIFMHTALEAFMNFVIPKTFTYSRSKPRHTEVFDCSQIQRFIPCEEKLDKVMSAVFAKSFALDHPAEYKRLLRLLELRNNLIHTKALVKGPRSIYEALYTEALDFDYYAALKAVRAFLNYHSPSLIEDCDCDREDGVQE